MSCRETRALLHKAAEVELRLEERLALDAHVSDCARCAPLARRFAALDEAFTQLPEPPVDSVDVEAQVRAIRARLERESAPARPRMRFMGLAAAAALLAALFGIVFLLKREGADQLPSIVDHSEPAPAPSRVLEAGPEEPLPATTPDTDARASSESELANTLDGAREVPALPVATGDASDGAPRVEVPEPPSPAELARTEDARGRLALALAEVGNAAELDRDALALAFDSKTAALARERWPLTRFAEGLSTGDDARAARAALRYLGVRGDRNSVTVLARSVGARDRADDAVLALADLGEPALDVLVQLLADERHEPRILARIEARSDGGSAQLLEALVRRVHKSEAPLAADERAGARARRSRVALALARSESTALDALLRLTEEGVLESSESMALARLVPSASERLAALLRSPSRRVDARLWIEAVAALQPAGGIAWLDARAREDRELREPALAAIAEYPEADAAEVLVRWETSGRLAPEKTRDHVRRIALRNAKAVAELARRYERRRDRVSMSTLHALAVEQPAESFTDAYFELAASPLLVRGDRRDALDLAAELATDGDVPAFRALFDRLGEDERELRAACVLAIFRLGGRAALEQLFVSAPARALDRLQALCEGDEARARPTTTFFRVLQELDGFGSRSTP